MFYSKKRKQDSSLIKLFKIKNILKYFKKIAKKIIVKLLL